MVFQLDKFLAEQDAISAMPDEDVDTYIQRLSTQPSRRMDWTDKPVHIEDAKMALSVTTSKDEQVVQNQASSILQEDADLEVRRLEPEASFGSHPINIESQTPEIPEGKYDIPGLGLVLTPQANLSRPTGSSQPTSSHPEPLFPSSSPGPEKRKITSDFDSYPNKRRALSPDAPADGFAQGIPEPQSPILSFTKSPQIVKPRRQIVVDQGPQLQLVPIVAEAIDRSMPKKGSRPQITLQTNVSHRPTGRTPPIGSPDFTIAETHKPKTKKRAIPSEPSKLMLELKERVARHAATEPRPKTMPLAKTALEGNLPDTTAPMDDSSIIYVPSSPSPRASSPSSVRNAKKQARLSVEKKKQPAKTSTGTKTKKEKPKSMTPFEYAELLRTEGLTGKAKRKNVPVRFLEGYHVFYTGGDRTFASETTRNRMDLLIRYGGNLLSKYDPDVVTHIITEATPRPTLSALGLTRLEEIPIHIPTVKWSWVTLGMGYANHLPKDEIDEKLLDYLFQHAAFSSRMDAGPQPILSKRSGKAKQKVKSITEEDSSRISDFSQDAGQASTSANAASADIPVHSSLMETPVMLPSPSISPQPRKIGETSSSRVTLNQDPLAEFYEQAKVAVAQDSGFLSAPPSDDEEGQPRPSSPKKSRYTCDNKEAAITNCVNQDVIDKLSELMEIHKAKPGQEDYWRAFAYSKAIRALKYHPRRIKSYEDALALRGVGDKTAQKIAEILETGELRRIEYEKTEDVEVTRLFQGIYGVGRSTAYKWYSAGCRTLDDLRKGENGVKLSAAQEIGLQFYDDINERMPRREAEEIYKLIEPIALSIDPKLFIRIMGSFRRGKATCGDIDILITRPDDDGKTHIGVLPRLFKALHKAGILTEDLATPEDSFDLEAIYRGLCRRPDDPKSKRRRIDFLTVPWKARGAALLYYTGDDIFNRALRYKAGSMGYSLNQRGLYTGIVRDPHDRRIKLSEGHIVASETEEEIFKILGVPWQEPHERVRG